MRPEQIVKIYCKDNIDYCFISQKFREQKKDGFKFAELTFNPSFYSILLVWDKGCFEEELEELKQYMKENKFNVLATYNGYFI